MHRMLLTPGSPTCHRTSHPASTFARRLMLCLGFGLAAACMSAAPALALDPRVQMTGDGNGLLAYPSTPLLRPTDRVIFIGDSITGQGANVANGWRHLIQKGLTQANPENKQTLISLGGSGQGVGSWTNVEKKSRTEPQFLDVKGVGVKAELDQPADVVVFMLGMNDALSPSMADTPEAMAKWMETYAGLIKSVRDRTNPRVVAIATPTLCTESDASPKNIFLDGLSGKIRELAKMEGYYVLPTRWMMREIREKGRIVSKPDFHVTSDYVHPNFPGHYAIAAGMLRGLGELKAQEVLAAESKEQLWGKPKNTLSYSISERKPTDKAQPPGTDALVKYDLKVWYTQGDVERTMDVDGPDVTIGVPQGWKVSQSFKSKAYIPPVKSTGADIPANFTVSGIPDRLENVLTITLKNAPADVPPLKITIQAPWLIGVVQNPGRHWQAGKLDPAKAALQPADAEFAVGKGFTPPVQTLNGKPVSWYRYVAGVDWDGNNQPGSIDIAAIHYYQVFYTAYGARWLYSEKDRPVEVLTSPLGFVNNNYLTLWVNGQKLVDGQILKRGDKSTATLKKGWNSMVFRSDHSTWLWAFSLDVRGLDGDDLNDVRVAIADPNGDTPSPAAAAPASTPTPAPAPAK